MLIANPIYDVVFKYLMEDLEIARQLLSVILDVEIEELDVATQETTVEVTTSEGTQLAVIRFDFRAVILLPNGLRKNVLIELQKAKRTSNVMRFRRYLARNYTEIKKQNSDGTSVIEVPFEIISIYILGYSLESVPAAILKVDKVFRDLSTNKVLEISPKEDFVRKLTHESYFIQIPRLVGSLQSRMERVLMIFSQKHLTGDKHWLDIEETSDDPLTQKMITRLNRAMSNDDMRRSMDAEDEYENAFLRDQHVASL